MMYEVLQIEKLEVRFSTPTRPADLLEGDLSMLRVSPLLVCFLQNKSREFSAGSVFKLEIDAFSLLWRPRSCGLIDQGRMLNYSQCR